MSSFEFIASRVDPPEPPPAKPPDKMKSKISFCDKVLDDKVPPCNVPKLICWLNNW
ncbi:hypothetical protein SESBI_07563 [Sesbania bispinosa]|nr:hypothetical protein SESBI_07563 [Sesbania bispinosa]